MYSVYLYNNLISDSIQFKFTLISKYIIIYDVVYNLGEKKAHHTQKPLQYLFKLCVHKKKPKYSYLHNIIYNTHNKEIFGKHIFYVPTYVIYSMLLSIIV